jgi:hypothetical protein
MRKQYEADGSIRDNQLSFEPDFARGDADIARDRRFYIFLTHDNSPSRSITGLNTCRRGSIPMPVDTRQLVLVREVVSHLAAERFFKRLPEPLCEVFCSCRNCEPTAFALFPPHNDAKRIIYARAISFIQEKTAYLVTVVREKSAFNIDKSGRDAPSLLLARRTKRYLYRMSAPSLASCRDFNQYPSALNVNCSAAYALLRFFGGASSVVAARVVIDALSEGSVRVSLFAFHGLPPILQSRGVA